MPPIDHQAVIREAEKACTPHIDTWGWYCRLVPLEQRLTLTEFTRELKKGRTTHGHREF
jgi:hypothetical protein